MKRVLLDGGWIHQGRSQVMRLHQQNAGVAFDPPVNAQWTTEEAPFPAPVFVTVHPEILNHKSTFQQDGASPFVTAVWHFADYDEFQKHESMRMLVRQPPGT